MTEKAPPKEQRPKWKIENPTVRTVVVEKVELRKPASASPAPEMKLELGRVPAAVRSSVG